MTARLEALLDRDPSGVVITGVGTWPANTVAARVGEAPRPVLLLHAIGLDWRMWRGVMHAMAQSHALMAIDLPGFGAASDRGVPSMAAQGDEVAWVLDELGVSNAHIVGLSYGGAVALQVALDHPERVASLVLIATLANPPGDILRARADAAEISGRVSYVDETLRRWFTAEECGANGSGVRYARHRLYMTPLPSWVAGWRALADVDLLDRLSDVVTPTTVIAGALDTSAPPAAMRDMAARIKDASYAEIADSAHLLALERPAELAVLLTDHVARAERVALEGSDGSADAAAGRLGAQPVQPVLDLGLWTAPHASGDSGPTLLGSRCAECGAAHFPRRAICFECGSTQVVDAELAGRGTLYSATTVHVSGETAPYTIGYIDLDEGVRVLARLPKAASELDLDTRVHLEVGPDGSWQFALDDPAGGAS